MKYAFVIAATGVLGSAVQLMAQQDSTSAAASDSTPRWTIGAFQLRSGTTQLGLQPLNAELSRNGRPTFTNTVASFGLSGYMRRGRLILGTSAEAALPQLRRLADARTRLWSNSTSLDVGVAIVDAPGVLVYPVTSIGLRQTRLRIQQDGGFDYGDGLREPWRGLEMTSYTGVVEFGAVAERHITVWRGWPLAVALQAGVTTPVGGGASYSGDFSVAGVPRPHAGRYVRLAFGKPIRRRAEAFSSMGATMLGLVR